VTGLWQEALGTPGLGHETHDHNIISRFGDLGTVVISGQMLEASTGDNM